MVARINTGKSISKALNYNEQKIQQGRAEILAESGFIKEVDQLNFYDKINHFKRHISLNEKATTNSLHISLNFDTSEKLSNEKMVEIANNYMDKIGFGSQPYLIYRHHDAGHPHLHIVSTNIEKDGKRISMHRLGANQSEKARKEIEIEFKLVKAEGRGDAETKLIPVNAQKVSYGKSETKRAIANVLMVVLNQYKYCSLPELNAVLKLYNVAADRGSEESRMFQKKGLAYRVLDKEGNKVGTPIKASAFYMKPTLSFLEKKFIANETLKEPHKKQLQTSIGWILNKQPGSLKTFIKALEKENISAVLRQGKEQVIYGITYVDHKTKCVFNGSDLGKAYSAKAVLENCNQEAAVKEKISTELIQSNNRTAGIDWKLPEINNSLPPYEYVPYQLRKKKKRKRKLISI